MFRVPVASQMQLEGIKMNRFSLQIDSSTTISDIMQQRFWFGLHTKLKSGDIVDIFDLGRAIDVEVRILAVEDTIVRLRVLRAYADDDVAAAADATEETEADGASPADLEVDAFQWKQAGDGSFVIINKATKEPVLRGLISKKVALAKVTEMNAAARQPAGAA